jgi:hypothetical protein
MKRLGLSTIGIGVLASLGLLSAQQAHSSEQDGPTSCSNATLRGLYMYSNSGYQSVSPSLVPLAVTGKNIFYGNGKFDSLATLSIGGTIIADDAAPGTYTVNSDCTGTAIVHMTPPTPDVHLQWFVAPDGDLIFSTETDPGTVLTGTLQRVAR